jgi:hypothetical protein
MTMLPMLPARTGIAAARGSRVAPAAEATGAVAGLAVAALAGRRPDARAGG